MEVVINFLAMGGYAVYVWPAFALTMVVLVALLLASVRGLKARETALAALQQQAEVGDGAGRRRSREA